MQPISKTEMEYLISKGALIQNKIGSYKEVTGDKKMVVTGKYGNARGKQRYAYVPLFIRLLELKQKDKESFDIDKVKDNQKYLFSSERVS